MTLRMMPGGDLSYYLKEAKKKAKKEKDVETGLSKEAAQFYLASTVLGLEALHTAGFAPLRGLSPYMHG